ncbi:hypothetical protein Gogos_012640 [Gossypium gossypioides]|uniref:REJ domain-containing protein n=1 Tax=Gossypium gossypioides TaxID=34282 RepID=A0A7J9BT40_GOSGO|nr:hypothetical protein [Gossypium gossypioides]
MSSKRSSGRSNERSSGRSNERSSGSRSNENEDFSLRLRELLSTNKKKKRNAAKLLDETCNHIKKLNGEVDDLSNRISELLNSSETESSNINASILRQFLQQ